MYFYINTLQVYRLCGTLRTTFSFKEKDSNKEKENDPIFDLLNYTSSLIKGLKDKDNNNNSIIRKRLNGIKRLLQALAIALVAK